MATLAEIRAKLAQEAAQQEERKAAATGKRPSGGDNAQFLFFSMKPGQTSIFRFLPDADQDNIFPWLERNIIELPFDGTVGGKRDTTDLVKIKVPCPKMFHSIVPDYKLSCKITAHIAPWWDKKGTPVPSAQHKQAQKYYGKKSWLSQGFVVSTPLEDAVPENPIRRITMTKQVFDPMFRAYNGTDFEVEPHNYDEGTDFNINVTLQGQYNNYSTSDFQRRHRSLSAEERAAIEEYGLFTLREFIGKVPDQDALDAQYAMFLDSLAGKPYDFAQFGQYYRPYGVDGPDQQSSDKPVENAADPVEAARDVVARETETKTEAAPISNLDGATSQSTEDLIARIRRNALKTAE